MACGLQHRSGTSVHERRVRHEVLPLARRTASRAYRNERRRGDTLAFRSASEAVATHATDRSGDVPTQPGRRALHRAHDRLAPGHDDEAHRRARSVSRGRLVDFSSPRPFGSDSSSSSFRVVEHRCTDVVGASHRARQSFRSSKLSSSKLTRLCETSRRCSVAPITENAHSSAAKTSAVISACRRTYNCPLGCPPLHDWSLVRGRTTSTDHWWETMSPVVNRAGRRSAGHSRWNRFRSSVRPTFDEQIG